MCPYSQVLRFVPFSVQKTTKHALGASIKDCVYIEALKGRQKSSAISVHALLAF